MPLNINVLKLIMQTDLILRKTTFSHFQLRMSWIHFNIVFQVPCNLQQSNSISERIQMVK